MATDTPDRPASRRARDEEQTLLEDLRERYDYATTQWRDIRTEAATDMRYVTGETWDEQDKKLRTGRLTLRFDQLSQYLNQLTNTVRQNKRAIKVTQDGQGATDQTAQLREGRIRQIEYLSHAQEAYTAAFSGAAERSYGFCRIVSAWEPKSFTKTLRIKAIPNPDQVLPDPDAQAIAGADWQYLFYEETIPIKQFERDYPTATVRSFTPAVRDLAPNWVGEDHVKIAEYWVATPTTRHLLLVEAQGQTTTCTEDEYDQWDRARQLPPEARIVDERDEAVNQVCQYLTNGVELLTKRGQRSTKTEWPGIYIPFAACYGKILYLTEGGHTKKVIQSYVRLGRDAAKYYNWVKSTEGEVISMVPKTPYLAYAGTLAQDQLALLQRSMYEAVPVVVVNPVAEGTGDRVLPLPRRELPEPPIQAYEVAAEAARRDIQNALGRYSIQDARLGPTKVQSGVALQQLDQAGDQGTFHFLDNYHAMITHVGVVLDDLLAHYDDTAKDVTIRQPDESIKSVHINEPVTDPQTGQTQHVRMDQGTHAITVGTGPSFDSEREAADAFAEQLIGSPLLQLVGPQKAPQILALAIRAKNAGPLIDQIADIIDPSKPQGDLDPRALEAQLQQLQQQLQQAHQLLGQASQELQGKQADAQAKLQITQMETDRAVQLETMRNATAIAVARINAAKGTLDEQREDVEEALALAQTQQHEAAAQLHAQAHDAALSAQAHQQALEQADQQHQQVLAQQDQAHAQALDQADQAAAQAALEPGPAAAGESPP